MFNRFVSIVCAAGMCCGSAPAAAQDAPVVLAPSGPWAADYAEESCALRRTFGAGETLTALELRQEEPDGRMAVTVVSPLRERAGDFRYAFLPDEARRKMGASLRGKRSQDRTVVSFVAASLRTVADTETFYRHLTQPDGEKDYDRLPVWRGAERERRIAEVTALALENAFAEDVTLLTGSMKQPMAALDKCLEDLLLQWGLDPSVQTRLSRRVAIKGFSFQKPAWRALQEFMAVSKSSNTKILFLVGPHCELSSCRVLGPAKNTPEAEALCQTYASVVRFKGALDASGQPVSSYYLDDIKIGIASLK